MQTQSYTELETLAVEILSSKKWERVAEHLSDMNKRIIKTVAKGKTSELSQTMQDYAIHAIEQGRQALKKAGKH